MAKAPNKKPASKAGKDEAPTREQVRAGQIDTICAGIADGDSLRSLCAKSGMPDKATVMRWLSEDDGFATKYARAREAQAEHHHDEMDRLEAAIEVGALNATAGGVILANKRWRMEKLKPKVYGTAVTLKGDPENPIESRTSLSESALEALAARGIEKGG